MKKKIVEVDEDVLKEIIVGDIPVFGKDSPAPKEKSVEHQEAKSPAATVPADTPAEKPSVEKPKRVFLPSALYLCLSSALLFPAGRQKMKPT